MKNKKLLITTIIYFILSVNLFAQEIKFQAEKMDIKDGGDTILAFFSNTLIPSKKINIKSNKANYNKKTEVIIFTNNVNIQDNLNSISIKSNKVKYEKKNDIFYSHGATKINIKDKYKIDSKNIYFDRNKQIIYGNEKTLITDDKANIYELLDTFQINLIEEVIIARNALIKDKDENNYLFENLMVNLKVNEIVGKELDINFKKSYFGNKKNDPVLKGRSSFSNDDELKVYKGVFSTCNIKNKECRGWELNTEEFKHDKRKKIFEYKNSWLKIFDYKVFYLPYFNHPDPSVKRKSGLLTPSYTTSDSLGTSINLPYFKILSVDKDITFNPRIYADKSFLLQNEYRQALQNSDILSDFSFLVGDAGTKGHLFYNQLGEVKNLSYEINLQNVRGDNYLKTHKLIDTSPLIENDGLLISSLKLNWNLDNSKLDTSFKIYEDLSRNYHDRFQYIFPDFNYSKNLEIPKEYNGNFNFNSYGHNKLYDTNVSETVLTNDFLFSSNKFVNSKGLVTDYDLLLKNSNDYSKNSSNYDENLNYNLFGVLKIDANYPLQKIEDDYVHLLKPIASFRYSPNGNTDMSNKDVFLNYNSVFNLNRIGSNSQVEGGESLSLGLEYIKKNNLGLNKIDFKLANVLKADEDHNMPSKSKLNNKRSDFFGDLKFGINENLNLNYNFSYDKDLKYSNLDQFSFDFSVNNFYTNVSYYSEHNDLPDVESIKNTSKFEFNEENKLTFEISKDLNENFTQYYDLIYTHETDCISLNLSFNKSFYNDGSLEPSKSLSFLLKIIPFTEIGVPNLGNLVGQ